MLNCCLCPSWNVFAGFFKFFLMYFHHWVSVWPLIMVPNFPLQDLVTGFSADITSLPWAVFKITSMQLLCWNPFILGKDRDTREILASRSLLFFWLSDPPLPRHSTPLAILSLFCSSAVENFLSSLHQYALPPRPRRGPVTRTSYWANTSQCFLPWDTLLINLWPFFTSGIEVVAKVRGMD